MTFTEAVTRAKQGDNAAWEELYTSTCKEAYFVAVKVCGKEQDAADLVQDAYITAYQRLDQLQDPEKFRSWLNMIVANRCRDYLKKNRPALFSEIEPEDGMPLDWADDREYAQPDAQIDHEETVRLVAEIISSLPEDQRLCVMLYYREELSVSEIAKALEVSEGTVKSRLNYARQKIAKKVKELEKQGTKLYGLAPLPFLLFLLRKEANAAALPAALASSASVAVRSTASTVAGSTASAFGAKCAVAAGAKSVFAGIGAKIVAGVLAAAVAIGGGVLIHQQGRQEIDLSDYIVIEGVSGLNGEGTAEYYFDEYLLLSDMIDEITEEEMEKMSEKELEKAMTERLEMLDEVGDILSCITFTAVPETGLSNGDTVLVAAKFEDNNEFEFDYTFKNGSQTYTVSGLKDPIVIDPLSNEHITVTFSGFDGVGEASLEVAQQSSDYPDFSYVLSENKNLCNGDTITVTVQYNQHQLETLGYRVPAVTERVYTVSGLTEFFDISKGILEEDMIALCEHAYAGALGVEAAAVEDGGEILSASELVYACFMEVSEPGMTYRDSWYGIDMTNSVVIVSTYTVRYTGIFGFTRTYYTLWFYPDCTATEDGHLAYSENELVCYSVWADDFDGFSAWFAEEFNTMEITQLAIPSEA